MFGLYRQDPDPGDVAIRKQYFAIDDTRVPVTSTPFQLFGPFGIRVLFVERRTDCDQISQAGHHRGACRLIPPGLHRIE